MESGNDILFHEVQRMRQWWVWLLVIVCGAGAWYVLLGVVVFPYFGLGGTSEGASSSILITILWLAVGIGLPLLLLFMKLDVTVYPDRLVIRYPPFVSRDVTAGDLESAAARTYRPIIEYGGWGLRWSPRFGSAYNVSGNRGLQLHFKNGKKLLIGSRRADELAAAVERMLTTVA